MSEEITDDTIVKVYLKIRAARSKLAAEYKEQDQKLQGDLAKASNEILRRLLERKSTQTKTDHGTAFVGEDMQVSIADEGVFRQFVLDSGDLNWYQKRVKVEHLREYMKASGGRLPPGLNVFREKTILVRAPKKGGGSSGSEVEEFEQFAAAAAQQEN